MTPADANLGSTRGRFIAFEGLDGVGKSTLTAGVAVALGAEILAMPGFPRPIAHTVFTGLGHDATARCLFHAACARALGIRALELAASGRNVVIDRYWLSSVAYARARGAAIDFTAVEEVIPVPGVSILVTLDEPERRRRLDARGATAVDRETMTDGFPEAVYAELGRTDRGTGFPAPNAVDVSGLAPDAALDRVLTALRDHGVVLTPKHQER